MRTIVCVGLIAATVAASDFTPARRVGGLAPAMPPPTTVGWLEETVDLAVDARGAVGDIVLLRGTSPSPSLLGAAVATWQFRPAADDKGPVSSHVLVVALIRPPQLSDGPTLGSRPADFGPASDEVPYPTAVHRPRYPPLALGESIVLVEVLIGVDGRVQDANIVHGAAGFDDEALLTARQWVFRPARRNGELVSAHAYLAFGFRQPVTG
jgi:TonB family protein